MKKLIITLGAVFCLSTVAFTQATDQQLQNKIVQLRAQKAYNDALILDLNRKAFTFDQEIQQTTQVLRKLRQAVPKKAEQPKPELPPVEKESTLLEEKEDGKE